MSLLIDEACETILSQQLSKTVIEFFGNPENREKFEEWYLSTHGEKYQWKRRDKNATRRANDDISRAS